MSDCRMLLVDNMDYGFVVQDDNARYAESIFSDRPVE